VIAGEYGSGLHNAIFSREARHVIAFNWINLVQQAIGMARGHGNIFILPEGGQPILAPLPNTAAQTVTTEYNIPLEMAMRAFELSNES
jgi:O-antigen biosynthesis protein WbqL